MKYTPSFFALLGGSLIFVFFDVQHIHWTVFDADAAGYALAGRLTFFGEPKDSPP